MIIQNCVICSKSFSAKSSEVKRGNAKTCSRRCGSIYANRDRQITNVNVTCSFCQKSLMRPKKQVRNKNYCNRDCKAKAEYKGNQNRKAQGAERRAHLAMKEERINQYGVVCQFPYCSNELFGDRSIVDLHHFSGTFEHDKTVLLCGHHHKIADKIKKNCINEHDKILYYLKHWNREKDMGSHASIDVHYNKLRFLQPSISLDQFRTILNKLVNEGSIVYNKQADTYLIGNA